MSRIIQTHLIIIDPQMDFLDTPGNAGSLAVAGAYDDMGRLAAFVKRMGQKLADIHITMDSHHLLDISHPAAWVSATTGQHPDPFTIIAPDDIGYNKSWIARTRGITEQFKKYSQSLAARNRYPHIIWPPHCLIGSVGATVDPRLFSELLAWEDSGIGGIVDKITKGSNPFTEHYSAVQAEVPDPSDPSTQVNVDFVRLLGEADQLIFAGEALSHCLANTGRDLYNQFQALFNQTGGAKMAELILFDDCTSNVTGFDKMGDDFIRDFKSWGGKVMKSTDYGK